jgi:hypothetical protein
MDTPRTNYEHSTTAISHRTDKQNHLSELYNEIRENRSHTVPVFTDDAKTQIGNGCAMVYPDLISTFKLPTLFTVFSNELTAIKEAMTYILQANGSQLLIFTDLKSAVVEIQDPFTTNNNEQDFARSSNTKHRITQ